MYVYIYDMKIKVIKSMYVKYNARNCQDHQSEENKG